VGCVVRLDREPYYCYGVNEFSHARGEHLPVAAVFVALLTTGMQIVYFGRSLPWIIIDATPYFRKWKLQANKIPTAAEQWECTKQVLFSHFTIELPLVCIHSYAYRFLRLTEECQIWLFHPTAEGLGMSTYHVPFPSLKTMAPQVFLFFVFEDFFHFLGM